MPSPIIQGHSRSPSHSGEKHHSSVVAAEIARLLELEIRLKGRVRVDEELWHTFIEHRLKASESRDAL